MSSQEFRHIVRILGSDSAGTLKVSYAVTEIKGVSLSLANAVLKKAGIREIFQPGTSTEDIANYIKETLKER